ncbi:hypothetical protein HXX76_000184 [Chlamydomonas incerta]|uniref:cyclin-dependent kinase n=1 Tax=Chlamydomonas incerta TaxID=51695 RepID=A0A835WDT3_CHLIN|nr:hypothetical protein HXX76_000184 [Chlamydomonas incerta]|eukprot:KAG2445572.1 hypothetical protein HXX76_000184 [Chlamydomonas incerta]
MCARAGATTHGEGGQSQQFSPKSLSEPAANRYEFVRELDEGSYGCVFACVQRPSGRLVAVKVCKHTEDPVVRRLLLREVGVLRSLPRHPCVVELLDAFRSRSSGRPHLVFECMERSAQQELEALDETRMCPVQLKLVAWQVVMGLAHCHRNNVVHRDLKPGNILLTGSGAACNAKLCDFGFARNTLSGRPDMQERLSSYVVTRWYRAPEILVGDKYGMASDVWALGCTLAELANGGLPLLPGTSSLDQLARIMRCCGPLPPCQALCLHANRRLAPLRKPPPRSRTVAERLPGVDPALVALVTSCLQTDPALRPAARRLLNHPYFADVPRLLRGSPLHRDLLAAAEELQQPTATVLAPQLAVPSAGVAGTRHAPSQQLRELQQWASQRRLLAVTATAAAEAAAAEMAGGPDGTAGARPVTTGAAAIAAPSALDVSSSALAPASSDEGAARFATEAEIPAGSATAAESAAAASAGARVPSAPPGVAARTRPFIAQAVSGGVHSLQPAATASPADAAAAEAKTAATAIASASPWTSAVTAAAAAAAAPAAAVAAVADTAPAATRATTAATAAAPALSATSHAGLAVAAERAAAAAPVPSAAVMNPYARLSGEPAWVGPSHSEGIMRLQPQTSTSVNAESVAVNALSAPLACRSGGSSSGDEAAAEPAEAASASKPEAAAAAGAQQPSVARIKASAASGYCGDGDGESDGADTDATAGGVADEEDVDTPTAAAPAAGHARNALRRRAAITGFLVESSFNGGSGSGSRARFGGTIPVFAAPASSLAPAAAAAAADAASVRPGSAATAAGLVCAAVRGSAAGTAAGGATAPSAAAGTPQSARSGGAGRTMATVSSAGAAADVANAAALATAAACGTQEPPVMPAGTCGTILCSTSSVLLAQLLDTNSPLSGSTAVPATSVVAAVGGGTAAEMAAASVMAAAAMVANTPLLLAPPSTPLRLLGAQGSAGHTSPGIAGSPFAPQQQDQALPEAAAVAAGAEQRMHMLAQYRSMCKRFASRSLCHVDCPPAAAEHTAVPGPEWSGGWCAAAAAPQATEQAVLLPAAALHGAGAHVAATVPRAGYAGRALSSSGVPAGAAPITTFGEQEQQRPPLTQQQLDVERPSPAGLPAAMREAFALQEQARRMRVQQQQQKPLGQTQQAQRAHRQQDTAGQPKEGEQADGYGWSFVSPTQAQAVPAAQHKQHLFSLQDSSRYYTAHSSAVPGHAAAGAAGGAAATAAAAAAAMRLPHERAPTPIWLDGGSISTTGGRSSCGVSNTAIAAVAAAAAATAAAAAPSGVGAGAATPDFAYSVPLTPSALGMLGADGDGAASGRAAISGGGGAVSGHEWAAVGTFADGLVTQAASGLPQDALEGEDEAQRSGPAGGARDPMAAADAGVNATKPAQQQHDGSAAAAAAVSGGGGQTPGAATRANKGRCLGDLVAAVLGGCFGGGRGAARP